MFDCTIKFPPVAVPKKGTGVVADRNGYIHPKDFPL